MGETDAKVRWHSALASGKFNPCNPTVQFASNNGLCFGNRFESSAAASDASAESPAERFEYQAEVMSFHLLGIF